MVICFICFAAVCFIFIVCNSPLMDCVCFALQLGKCFVCQEVLQCLLRAWKGGGMVPLFNPGHQSHSTSLSYRAIQRLWWLKLALLSACHWLAVLGSLVENQLCEWMPRSSRCQAPGMRAVPLKSSTLHLPSGFHTFQLALEKHDFDISAI